MAFFWIAVLVLAIVLEAYTADFIAIWFFPAALISMILAFCEVSIWVQIPAFLGVGLILILTTRRICMKFLKTKGDDKTNTDVLIGKEAFVTEEISNITEKGEVKVNGLRWSARAEDSARVIAEGEIVTVVAIQGVKLIVK